jgi:hypothetical protein
LRWGSGVLYFLILTEFVLFCCFLSLLMTFLMISYFFLIYF